MRPGRKISVFSALAVLLAAFLTIAANLLSPDLKSYLEAEPWYSFDQLLVVFGVLLLLSVLIALPRQRLYRSRSRSPDRSELRRNRRQMLKRVRADWIGGILERSIYRVARIEVGLEERLDSVERPLELISPTPASLEKLTRPSSENRCHLLESSCILASTIPGTTLPGALGTHHGSDDRDSGSSFTAPCRN